MKIAGTPIGTALGTYGISDYYSNDETTVWLYPNADFVYKKDTLAVFGNFGVYAGGGSLSYSEGTSATTLLFAGAAMDAKDAATKYAAGGDSVNAAKYNAMAGALIGAANDHSLDVTSITYGGQLGLSYKIIENLSFAAGLRYVHGTQDLTIKAPALTLLANGSDSISYEANGWTVSGVFGFHYKPLENLDLAVQYQSKSAVKYEVENVKGNLAKSFGIYNGKTFHTDLPAALNLGAGWKALDQLYLSASFNYYFNYFANQDSILGETDYDNSWEVAVGADYDLNKYIGLSCGLQYGKQGTTDTSNSTFNPVLDSFCIGAGVEVHPTEPLTVTLAGLWAKYFNKDYYLEGNKTELSKKVINLSLGVTYHFPGL